MAMFCRSVLKYKLGAQILREEMCVRDHLAGRA